MRVLMATMQLGIGGAETHIVELSKALKRMGVEVMVASNGGAYVKELEESGIKHFEVELNRKNPASLRKAYKSLKNIIIKNNIDIVHAHARIPAFLCGLLSKRMKLRFVTTAHWVFTTRFPFNLLTDWGSRSLAVSDDIKKYLIDSYGCESENIRVTINGVDTDKFSDSIDYSDIAKEFGFGEDKERIVYVSRMDTDRSLAAHKLIEAVPSLYQKFPSIEVVIVGGGNDLDKIKQEAEAQNKKLGKRVVIVTGGRTDINKFAASAQVFVGVSRAALEAMACKKPAIIAGNEGYIGVFDETKLSVAVDTNFCCRGCEEVTASRLEEDLLNLLGTENAERRSKLGEYALEIVKKYYSVDTMAKDALMMYASVATGIPVNLVNDENIAQVENYLVCGQGKRDVDVVLSGYYGFHNSGDDSILGAIIKDLKNACPNISITVLSKVPAETQKIYGVESVGRLDFVKLWSLFKRTRLLISGGGSLIQDVTSSKSLYYYLFIIRLAKLRGAKTMLYANGIGPVVREKNVGCVRETLKNIEYITLREESSLEELERLMGKEVKKVPIEVTADPVFTADAEGGDVLDSVLKAAGMRDDDKYFVISVRDWKTIDDDFCAKICDFSERVYKQYAIKPLVVPMQSKFDKKISESIARELAVPCGVCLEACSPRVMMGIIGRAEFVLGMRLHTLLYAVKMGVPCIGLDYDPKVESAMKSAGLGYFEKVEKINVDSLFGFAKEILNHRSEIAAEIEEKSKEFKALAMKNTEIAISLLKE